MQGLFCKLKMCSTDGEEVFKGVRKRAVAINMCLSWLRMFNA